MCTFSKVPNSFHLLSCEPNPRADRITQGRSIFQHRAKQQTRAHPDVLCDQTGALVLGKAATTHGITLKAVVTGGTLSDVISHTGTTDISAIIASWADGYHWTSPAKRQMMMDNSGACHYHTRCTQAMSLCCHKRSSRGVLSSENILCVQTRCTLLPSGSEIFCLSIALGSSRA